MYLAHIYGWFIWSLRIRSGTWHQVYDSHLVLKPHPPATPGRAGATLAEDKTQLGKSCQQNSDCDLPSPQLPLPLIEPKTATSPTPGSRK